MTLLSTRACLQQSLLAEMENARIHNFRRFSNQGMGGIRDDLRLGIRDQLPGQATRPVRIVDNAVFSYQNEGGHFYPAQLRITECSRPDGWLRAGI